MNLDVCIDYQAKEKLGNDTKHDINLKGNEFTIKDKQWSSSDSLETQRTRD